VSECPRDLMVCRKEGMGENIFEVMLLAESSPQVMARICEELRELNVDVISGFHAKLRDKRLCRWTLFINLSCSQTTPEALVSSLLRIQGVLEVNVIKPKPLIVESFHFPLTIDGDSALIMRGMTFADLQKKLEELFETGAELILYEAGRSCGRRSCHRIKRRYGLKGMDLLEAVRQIKRAEGWGEVDFSNFELDRVRGSIIVRRCFEAVNYGKSDRPVCHFMRGYLEGVLEETLGKIVRLMEVRCAATGQEYCEFRVRHLEDLMS